MQGELKQKVGPFSRSEKLAVYDRRTRLGKTICGVREALTDQLGGNPSAAEQILIRTTAIKVARLLLMEERVLEEAQGKAKPSDPHFWLAWSNSLRRDLEALGLKAIKDDTPSLTEYIAAKAKKGTV